MIIQVLRLHHYGETPAEDRRITLSPHEVTTVAVTTEDVLVQGRKLVSVTVLMKDAGSIDLVLSHSDIETLEAAIGSYVLPSEGDIY